MADLQPSRGHVRLTGGPDKGSARVEVFDGTDWMLVRGVAEVVLDLSPPFTGPVRLKLTVMPRWYDVVASQVELERGPEPALAPFAATPPGPRVARGKPTPGDVAYFTTWQECDRALPDRSTLTAGTVHTFRRADGVEVDLTWDGTYWCGDLNIGNGEPMTSMTPHAAASFLFLYLHPAPHAV